MTRPSIVRADTIDLQDQAAPSAKDHSRQPTHPGPLGVGPHQASTLKRAEESSLEDQQHSPRVSWGGPEDDELNGNNGTNGTTGDLADHAHQDNRDGSLNGVNPSSAGEDGDLADGEGDDGMDDDMMDKISSSPSIDDEDIDFEFVYALHTFVATVEGQANATKGDTMVLLDDSNSYWWLVRVAKDSSIGYLPAEHIETPTERLARLNKHRNIDLSATMLGDNPERSKNPLKKAMRRRNAKTVTFTSPTYYEASDVEYSTDGEDQAGTLDGHDEDSVEAQQGERNDDDEISAVEPLKTRGSNRDADATDDSETSNTANGTAGSAGSLGAERPRTSDDSFDRPDGVHKSRNGTVRNTDSFFKDDSVETRKITLTPNLLRDDSSNSTVRSTESREAQNKPRASLDTLEKVATSPEKSKDDKRKKEKKSGMLSGLFKRKDKKSKGQDEDIEELIMGEKASTESSRRSSPVPKTSEELSEPSTQQGGSPQKQTTRLQKVTAVVTDPKKDQQVKRGPEKVIQIPPPDRPAPTLSTMRAVDSEADLRDKDKPSPLNVRSTEQRAEQSDPNMANGRANGGGRSATGLDSVPPSLSSQSRPDRGRGILTRDYRDQRSSSPDSEELQELIESKDVPVTSRPNGGRGVERLSESPVEVISPLEPSQTRSLPPLIIDSSSQEEASVSPISPSSSPEMIDAPEGLHHNDRMHDDTRDHVTPSPAATPTWSDASLRSYLEDDGDIRDLLVVVHDKSGVTPAGPDHPLMGGLYREENAKLAEITSRLDGLLGDWMARKSRSATR